MLKYEDLKYTEVERLDRDKTIFLMAVSPLEVHGPHLPLGTDVLIAEELIKRYTVNLAELHPDYTLIKMPSLFTGGSPLPLNGSIKIRARVLEKLIYDFGQGLAEQGFNYLFLADNHGGPGHQLAIEAAARKLWKKYRFYLINPFGLVFRYMVEHEPSFMNLTGLGPGECGDDPDSHAGTNETSLVLSIDEKIAGDYEKVAPSLAPECRGAASIFAGLARVFQSLGGRVIAADLLHLARTLAWIDDDNMKPYLGLPARASKKAGEAMLKARVQVAVSLFENALEGKEVKIRPLIWSLRFLRYFL